MIYTFRCMFCGASREIEASISVGPPAVVPCGKCESQQMQRDWKTDAPMLDTSACRDHNFIPHAKRVAQPGGNFVSKREALKREGEYAKMIQGRRAAAREAGDKSIKQKMAVPAEIYHGKIKETGDKKYWDDPKNVSRHKEWEVSK